MRIVQINATCGVGSTGKICVSISEFLNHQCIENYVLFSSGESENPCGIKYASQFEIKLNALKSRMLGNYGFNSMKMTKRLINELEKVSPDVIHLHNLHAHNCDLTSLFNYLKEKKIKTIWTFHDCWAFTGYCPHFTLCNCDKWKYGCENCVQSRKFSWFRDRSLWLYEKKKSLFKGLDLTIVTPSQWLADLVKESFLKDYPVKVIHNGIDLSVFKPTESDFRAKHHCEDKFILLGVAFGWGVHKGLDVFMELSKRLDDHFQIVLVGTDVNVDKKLPANIISIHRTQNQIELAEIYSAADLFVNPTREDNYPTVNMEALACGTPVVTFKTGGSPEILDETCGSVVDCDDIEALQKEIERIYVERPYSKEVCLKKVTKFDTAKCFVRYIDLYKRLD